MSSLYKILIGFATTVCLYGSACFSQPLPLIKYVGVENGLSNNIVNSLYLDHFGFMWMGTYDGLNRYDGYNFKVFRNIQGINHSLINNHITVLNGDKSDRIWIGTQKGISYYSYADSRFHHVCYPENGKRTMLTSAISAIAISTTGTAYIATDEKGLFEVRKGYDIATQIQLIKGKDQSVKALCFTGDGTLWLYVKDVGLCRLNPGHRQIQLVNPGLRNITKIINGDQHTLWIGTQNGLYQFDRRYGTFVRAPQYQNNDNIMNLMLDREKKLWISTDGAGLYTFDTRKNTISHLGAGREKGLLGSNSVAQVYEDHESRKWIATLRGGVHIIDQQSTQFRSVRNNPMNRNSLISNFVLSFAEDADHTIWIGTDGAGLSRWNRRDNAYVNFVKTTDKGSLQSNFITSILNDADNRIWVSSFSGGIDRFDPATRKFIHYNCYNTVKGAAEVDIWKLYQDRDKNIWAGTTRGGALYRYNRLADQFELFDNRLKDIHTLFQDSRGRLWAGNYTELIHIDPLKKKHEIIKINQAVRTINEDAAHRLWLGTEGGGLLRFDPLTRNLKRFTEQDGLPSNAVLTILFDAKNNLWCSTYNGLARFNDATGKFKNYYTSDGLQSNQFNYNAALKLSDGALLFGGINGFNLFYPENIQENKRNPKIVLTDFRINNIPIDLDSAYKDLSVVNLRKIDVPYNAAVSVNYAAIEFSFQDQIAYAYYLEGWDKGWNYVGKLTTAYYSKLSPGSYQLHIKSTDTEGAWSSNEKIILITILPPWYFTWWAYCIYITVFSVAMYVFQAYRNKQQRLRHEIVIANLNMEKEKELNEKKLNFFTNISHELRTPLTLIVNPIKDILQQKEAGQEKNDLNVVYRNARRLLSLVDQLLLFRKTESENDVVNMEKINLNKFAREIFLCFSYLAKNNHIDYIFECEDETLTINADRDKLEIVFFNLLSNALKFTPDGGTVILKITKAEHEVHIEVSDSGPGIPENVGEKLFDKFYKVMNKTSLKVGFGIGLYLVKNFIALHGGTISFQSSPGKGTSFMIRMPLGDPADLTDGFPLEHGLTYINELIGLEESDPGCAEQEHVANLELLISDLHTILIVDDHTEIIDYIRQMFKDKFRIYKASNGLDGLTLCREFLPDVVISDINMDGLNGIELCKAINDDAALSHIPVILLTADPSPEIRLMGIEVGAYDLITKPFDKELFTAKINGIIRKRSDLQAYFYNEITLKSDTHKVSQEDSGFLQRCIHIIEDNLSEEGFSVKTLASALGMSHSNLYKKIKATSGQSVNGFVRFIRLRKAAELLINTNLNINEAAFRVGINDIKYFREQFQKLFKLTPSEFVKKHRRTFHKYYTINAMS